MAKSSPPQNFPQRFEMKIAEFKRDEENNIIAVSADGTEVQLDFGYVAEHAPQVGDDYPAIEKPEEPAAEAA